MTIRNFYGYSLNQNLRQIINRTNLFQEFLDYLGPVFERSKKQWVRCHYQAGYTEFSLRHQSLKGGFRLKINKDMVYMNTR